MEKLIFSILKYNIIFLVIIYKLSDCISNIDIIEDDKVARRVIRTYSNFTNTCEYEIRHGE